MKSDRSNLINDKGLMKIPACKQILTGLLALILLDCQPISTTLLRMSAARPIIKFIEYRNSLYYGEASGRFPNGTGIFLDDDMTLYASSWKLSVPDYHTIIYHSHSKYIYGEWSEGLPNGYNVFRSGDTILIGNFTLGKLTRRFMVVFQKQRRVAIVEVEAEGQCRLVQAKQFIDEDDIKRMAQKISLDKTMPREYFSVVKFMNYAFVEPFRLTLTSHQGRYFFGFPNGIGIVFDDDYVIDRVGVMADKSGLVSLSGLGAEYNQNMNKEGNFESGNLIQYNLTRPVQQIKALLRRQHNKSIHFVNDYMQFEGPKIIADLELILKNQVITQISAQEPIDTQRSLQQELNDSLEYRQNTRFGSNQGNPSRLNVEGERLKKIKDELYRSIGRPGSEIKPKQQLSRGYIEAQAILTPQIPQTYLQKSKSLHYDSHASGPYQNKQIIDELKLSNPYRELDRMKFIKENKLSDYRPEPTLGAYGYEPIEERRARLAAKSHQGPIANSPQMIQNLLGRSPSKTILSRDYSQVDISGSYTPPKFNLPQFTPPRTREYEEIKDTNPVKLRESAAPPSQVDPQTSNPKANVYPQNSEQPKNKASSPQKPPTNSNNGRQVYSPPKNRHVHDSPYDKIKLDSGRGFQDSRQVDSSRRVIPVVHDNKPYRALDKSPSKKLIPQQPQPKPSNNKSYYDLHAGSANKNGTMSVSPNTKLRNQPAYHQGSTYQDYSEQGQKSSNRSPERYVGSIRNPPPRVPEVYDVSPQKKALQGGVRGNEGNYQNYNRNNYDYSGDYQKEAVGPASGNEPYKMDSHQSNGYVGHQQQQQPKRTYKYYHGDD